MFHYLDNNRIPKSTNGLESFFGHLKGNLNIHRGLSYATAKSLFCGTCFSKTGKLAIEFFKPYPTLNN